MSEKFRNKYRIASHRKPNWDYSADALYFLTIVTQNRECNLGKIVNTHVGGVDTHGRAYHQSNEMMLSDFGKIVEQEWLKSFEIRDELFLHEYIIMPNHLHAIVEIYNENRGDAKTTNEWDANNTNIDTNGVDTHGNVETHGRASLRSALSRSALQTEREWERTEPITPELLSIKRNAPKRLPQSISSFMAGFKSTVNTKMDDYIDAHQLKIHKYNRHNHFFQPNYHDHIIRNQQEYIRIKQYIINNPENWDKDTFYGKL